jgi:hypothetical protein
MTVVATPMQPGPLRPNTDDMYDFLSWWFKDCNRGQIELGWLDPQTKILNRFRRFDLTEIEECAAFAADTNAQAGANMYFRASTISETAGTFTTDADFRQAPGPWADHDSSESIRRLETNGLSVKPCGWIVTGRTPHVRAQTFWPLTEPLTDPDMVRDLNARLSANFAGDPAVVNPTRLMRLAGSIAWPVKQGRTIAELTGFTLPQDDRPRRHVLHNIAFALPKLTAPVAPAAPAAPAGQAASIMPGLNTARGLIDRIKAGDNWHINMVRLVAHWIGRGWSNAEILTAAEALTLPGYTAAQTAAEVAKAIEGGRRKWGAPDQDHEVNGDGPATPFAGDPFDPWDTLRPLSFPMDALPPELAAYASSRARAIGCDPAAVAMSCLSALSVALDGRSRLRMKRHDGWTVPPTLWVAIIGPSSARKSPAMKAGWAPLERRQSIILRDYAAALGAWEATPKETRGDKPQPPTRFVTHDGTMEAVQGILAAQDRGLGMVRDELAGFIGALEKYSGGKGGAADRAFFLTAFEGGAHVVDRVGRGTVAISNLLLAICGGIQPDRLANFGDLTDDGLWQRFIPVIMAPGGLGQDVPEGGAEAAYDALVQYVLGLQSLAAVLSADAMGERQAVERRLHEMEQAEALGGAFTSFIGKLHGLWGRIALVLHAASRAPERGGLIEQIDLETARRATRLVFDFIVPSAARVYVAMGGGAGKGEPVKDVAGYILTKKLDRLLASDLTRNVRCARGLGLIEVQRLVSPLVAGGWLAPEKDHGGNNAWVVNAAVHDQFAARAEREANRRAAVRALLVESVEANRDNRD